MTKEPRTEQFIMRIAPSELAMLRALAEDAGLAAADILRMAIRRQYRETFDDTPPKKKRAK